MAGMHSFRRARHAILKQRWERRDPEMSIDLPAALESSVALTRGGPAVASDCNCYSNGEALTGPAGKPVLR